MACNKESSTDSGWDNPFRPGGDLSREADEIVNMLKGRKAITPNETGQIGNDCIEGTPVKQTKSSVPHNGDVLPNPQQVQKTVEINGNFTEAQVADKVIPGPTTASHVIIDAKRNKKKKCCILL